ncbi:Ribonuclease E [compost metagenome]
MQFGSISKFGLMEMSRQRLKPALNEGSSIPCPRCGGSGHIRDTESSALQILRIIQEESLKDSTAAVLVQVPVEVASFLLNEKRTEITKIELKQRINVLLVPNKSLDTPNYKLERLKHDDPRLDNLDASYKLADEPDEATGFTRRSQERTNKQEPVIKGVLPDGPAPVAAPRPEVAAPVATPVAAKAVAAAPVAAPAAAAPAEKGFFGWLKSLFGGGDTPVAAPKPVVAAPAAAKPGAREERSDGRGQRDGGREGGRDGRSRGGRGGAEGRGREGGRGGREGGRENRPIEGRGEPRAEGRVEGRPEGRSEGRAEGRGRGEPRGEGRSEARGEPRGEGRGERGEGRGEGRRGEGRRDNRRDVAPVEGAAPAELVNGTQVAAQGDANEGGDNQRRGRGGRGGENRRRPAEGAEGQTRSSRVMSLQSHRKLATAQRHLAQARWPTVPMAHRAPRASAAAVTDMAATAASAAHAMPTAPPKAAKARQHPPVRCRPAKWPSPRPRHWCTSRWTKPPRAATSACR